MPQDDVVRVASHEAGHVFEDRSRGAAEVSVTWLTESRGAWTDGSWDASIDPRHRVASAIGGGVAEAVLLGLPSDTLQDRLDRVGEDDLALIERFPNVNSRDAAIAAVEELWPEVLDSLAAQELQLRSVATSLRARREAYFPVDREVAIDPTRLAAICKTAARCADVTFTVTDGSADGCANGDRIMRIRFAIEGDKDPPIIDLTHIQADEPWQGTGVAYRAMDELLCAFPGHAVRATTDSLNEDPGRRVIANLIASGVCVHPSDCLRGGADCLWQHEPVWPPTT
jgi:hypothetical protein